MHRHARGRGPDQHVADLLRVLEFGRGIDADVLRLRLDDASGGGHVAGRQHVLDLRDLQVERGEPVVRVIEVDLLRENPRALDLRDDRHALQRPLDQVRVVVELPIRVTVARHVQRGGQSSLAGRG